MMGHPPFPKGATSEEVRLVQQIHQVGSQQQDRVVRQTLSDAMEMLVELIEDRARRHSHDDQWDRPHDEGWAVLDRVVSGGQTGADQAGWRAAKASVIVTGGGMPECFLTEVGPWLRRYVRGVEMPGGGYPERTRANVRDSDATIWFGNPDSPGGRTTLRACTGFGKPVYLVNEGLTQPTDVVAGIEAEEVRVLNLAGNRESTEPGIGDRFERFLVEMFGLLAAR
jgi:Circularly permutated YpsA SLOG family